MTQSKAPFDAFAPSVFPDHDARGRAGDSKSRGRIVNEYRTALPSVACGIAAFAMAALTFGLLVVAPATIESGSEAIRVLPASQAIAMRPAEVVPAAARGAADEIQPAVGCDKTNRARLPEARCPQDADRHQPAKSDSRGAGCLDVS